jgi:hypothetical protein
VLSEELVHHIDEVASVDRLVVLTKKLSGSSNLRIVLHAMLKTGFVQEVLPKHVAVNFEDVKIA